MCACLCAHALYTYYIIAKPNHSLKQRIPLRNENLVGQFTVSKKQAWTTSWWLWGEKSHMCREEQGSNLESREGKGVWCSDHRAFVGVLEPQACYFFSLPLHVLKHVTFLKEAASAVCTTMISLGDCTVPFQETLEPSINDVIQSAALLFEAS